jgi:hypothetical protein
MAVPIYACLCSVLNSSSGSHVGAKSLFDAVECPVLTCLALAGVTIGKGVQVLRVLASIGEDAALHS